ncbi:hypothetical protein EDD80_11497, partial [Anseongella ginsenosidimutans]
MLRDQKNFSYLCSPDGKPGGSFRQTDGPADEKMKK